MKEASTSYANFARRSGACFLSDLLSDVDIFVLVLIIRTASEGAHGVSLTLVLIQINLAGVIAPILIIHEVNARITA